MMTISVRLYEELNRVLPEFERKRPVLRVLPAGSSLLNLLAVLGLNPEEVDLALINSRSAPFLHPLDDQDRISLFPEFESLDIRGVSALRDRPLRTPKFVAERTLTALADLLKDRGYDCSCPPQASTEDLARISAGEKRILLTTNPDLAGDHDLDRCSCVHSREPEEQLRDVMTRFQLI